MTKSMGQVLVFKGEGAILMKSLKGRGKACRGRGSWVVFIVKYKYIIIYKFII